MKALSKEVKGFSGRTKLPVYAASAICVRYDPGERGRGQGGRCAALSIDASTPPRGAHVEARARAVQALLACSSGWPPEEQPQQPALASA